MWCTIKGREQECMFPNSTAYIHGGSGNCPFNVSNSCAVSAGIAGANDNTLTRVRIDRLLVKMRQDAQDVTRRIEETRERAAA